MNARLGVRSREVESVRAATSVCSLPPLAGEGWGVVETFYQIGCPPPFPSPASGGYSDIPKVRHSPRLGERSAPYGANVFYRRRYLFDRYSVVATIILASNHRQREVV